MITPKNRPKFKPRRARLIQNPRGFGLIEVMVAAALMSVVALGITSFMSQNNKNLLGMRTTSSRDQLVGLLAQYLRSNTSLKNSDAFSGSSSPTFHSNQVKMLPTDTYSFHECLTQSKCDTTWQDFTLLDSASTSPKVLAGGLAAAQTHNTGAAVSNASFYTADGQLCDNQIASSMCPIAVGIRFQGVCPTGAGPCTNATVMNIQFTIMQALDSAGNPISLNGGPTMKTVTSAIYSVPLPWVPNTGAGAGHLAVFDATGQLTAAPKGYEDTTTDWIAINTSTPQSLFEVSVQDAALGASGGMRVSNTAAGVGTSARFFAGTTANDSAYITFGGGGGTNNFYFGKDSDGGATKFMTITDQYKVGIGPTAPTADLHVSSLNTSTKLLLQSTGNNGYLNLDNTTGLTAYSNAGDITLQSNAANLNFVTGGVNRMTVVSSGKIGVGTTAPTDPLNVKVNTRFDSQIGVNAVPGTGGYDVYVTGKLYADEVDSLPSSDIRLKKNIEPLEDALDKILQIKGVTYYWKDPKRPASRQVGVIAQDVEKVYPELVGKHTDGTKGVDYQKLVAPLIEALRELKQSNDDLKAEVKALKGEVEALKSRKNSR